MKKELREEILPSLIMLAADIALYCNVSAIQSKIKYDIGSGGFPRLLTVLIGILLAVRIAASVQRMHRAKKAEPAEKQAEAAAQKAAGAQRSWARGLGTIALMGVYVALFKPVGFIVDTVVYLFVQQVLFMPLQVDRKKYFITISAVALLVPTAAYFIFVYGLHVMLPRGVLDALLP